MDKFRKQMDTVFATRTIRCAGEALNGTAQIDVVTSDIEEAVSGVELIFVVVPAFAHLEYAKLLAGKVQAGQLVVLLPGTLGTLEFAQVWRELGAGEGVVLAESDTLPYATRLEQPGVVRVHAKITIQLGVLPASRTDWAVAQLAGVLDLIPVSNVLEAGLSSMNPIDHPPGTILNAGRIERSRGEFYIYEEGMTPSVVRVMDQLDQERITLGETFGLELLRINELLHLSGYGPKGTTWEVLNGSRSLTPIKGPSDLNSRYLSEDIPFGLMTFASVASIVGVSTPVMNSLIELGRILIDFQSGQRCRTAEHLGLTGLTVGEITRYVTTGAYPVKV